MTAPRVDREVAPIRRIVILDTAGRACVKFTRMAEGDVLAEHVHSTDSAVAATLTAAELNALGWALCELAREIGL